jgi:hydrogenase maturation factor
VGDNVILTKGIAIEGTAVLARELEGQLAAQVGESLVARGRNLLKAPGISVLRDAEIACRVGRPHAMHDPTEGGLATGLWELSYASGKEIVIDQEEIYLYPETVAFCQALDLDPLGLIASGALLLTATPEDSQRIIEALTDAEIPAAVIGKVLDGPPQVQVNTGDGLRPLPTFGRDELARLFS